MRIKLLGKSLIPYVYEIPYAHGGNLSVFELMVHGLEFKSDTCDPVELARVTLTLLDGNEAVLSRIYERAELRCGIDEAATFINRIINTPYAFGPGLLFSRSIGKRQFVPSTVLRKRDRTAIVMTFLSVVGRQPNKLTVTVDYMSGGKGASASRTFLLKQYHCKNKYIFPVRVASKCTDSFPTGRGVHRWLTSQEFAFDISPMNARGKLYSKFKSNRDYYGFHADVIAPARGKVVLARDGMPDNEKLHQVPEKLEIERYGLTQACAGNVVILKHRFNEYSLFAHCACGSVKVKEGETVAQGQTVARIGNSGHSGAPHVHYQLMDGEDWFRSRSLPLRFTNIGDYQQFQMPLDAFLAACNPLVSVNPESV